MKRARPGNPVDVEDQKAAALTAAALECARHLGLSPTDTASILGVPAGALNAMKKGERLVNGLTGEAERADALVRIVKRLKALLGEADTHWRSWIRRENAALDARPLEIMLQRDGCVKVARFLENQRALQ